MHGKHVEQEINESNQIGSGENSQLFYSKK